MFESEASWRHPSSGSRSDQMGRTVLDDRELRRAVFGEGSERARVMLIGEQPGDREDVGTSGLIPEPFHVPTIVLAIEVEVPYRAPPSLDPPVLAVATIGPPAAFDPPPPDHVNDVVALPAPLEDRGHPRVTFDPNLLVEALGHG